MEFIDVFSLMSQPVESKNKRFKQITFVFILL